MSNSLALAHTCVTNDNVLEEIRVRHLGKRYKASTSRMCTTSFVTWKLALQVMTSFSNHLILLNFRTFRKQSGVSSVLMSESGFLLAICAGLFAALASVSSKLALEQDGRTIRYFLPCHYVTKLTCAYVSKIINLNNLWLATPTFIQVVFFLRSMCIVLMVLFNALMWTTFVKSLQKCGSTIQATVTNSAANFFFSVYAMQ